MKITAAILILVAAVATVVILGFGGSGASEAACKAAMEKAVDRIAVDTNYQPPEPDACKGLPYDARKRVANEVLSELASRMLGGS